MVLNQWLGRRGRKDNDDGICGGDESDGVGNTVGLLGENY